MQREVFFHKAPGLNENLKVVCDDKVGAGGAPTDYEISFRRFPQFDDTPVLWIEHTVDISFQKGPPDTQLGPNGISMEALLAVVLDRLECFQDGETSCHENGLAVVHVSAARAALRQRSERIEASRLTIA